MSTLRVSLELLLDRSDQGVAGNAVGGDKFCGLPVTQCPATVDLLAHR